jgi:gliding motility-associated-like protein
VIQLKFAPDPQRSPDYAVIGSLEADAEGNSYICGSFNGTLLLGKDTLRHQADGSSPYYHSFFVAKIDRLGNVLWGKQGMGGGHFDSRLIVADDQGSIYALRRGEGGIGIVRLNYMGETVWVEEFKKTSGYFSFAPIVTPGQLRMTGQIHETAYIGQDTLLSPYSGNGLVLAVTDTVPPVRPNVVEGTVYADTDADCARGPEDFPLAEVIIKAEPGSHYALTDQNGKYQLSLPPGQFTIAQVLPESKSRFITQRCPGSANNHSVAFVTIGNTSTGNDFGNEVTDRPLLAVDIAADRRRRCFRGQTVVKYANEGWAPAVDVHVKVVYPQYVVPISASVPWTKRQGDTLFFSMGTLPGNTTGVITLTDSVVCGNEAIRGLTQCVKAFLTPRNNAGPPDPQWDRSSLELAARCRNNGFVRLVIRNVGTGAMTDSTGYRIFLDAQRAFAARCKLGRNDSLVLEVPANGRTVRLEADQRPGHPGYSQPTLTIEGCEGTSPAQVSKGFVDQLPQDEADPETAVSCLPILDSFDPNDKQASPAGVTARRLIGERQEIEYLVRFQNTGTDVAYKVVIMDTLSPHLDPATLRMGAASHPFTWKVSGAGAPVITWTFDPIHLPDSTSNEPASHGFVRFRIAQGPDNPPGTVIANQAFIFFDYNAPIATNRVVHTVGEVPVSAVAARVVYCDGSPPSPARAGETITVHDGTTARLGAAVPQQGVGRWRLVSGNATLADAGDPGTTVTDLGVGKNVLEWSVTRCDQISVSQVTVERVVIPAAPVVQSPAPCCAGDVLLPLRAAGQEIAWFADAGLENELARGERYQPATNRTDTLYVTQTVNGYRSLPQAVVVTVRPVPAPPTVPEKVHYCQPDQPVVLRAEGQNVHWYRDAALTQDVGEGDALSVIPSAGTQYFVTQRLEGCQSKPAVVALHPGVAEPKSVYIANVITPNGDQANEAFRQPTVHPGTCIGAFRQVQIYNRWGKLVYESSDAQFAWNGSDQPAGVYYYTLRYSGYAYTGALSVLR